MGVVVVVAMVDLAQGSFRGMLGPVWGIRCGVLWCAEFEFEIA